MKAHLEIEFKTMLSEAKYFELLQDQDFPEGVIQINSYFDTQNNFFFSNKSMLRIRTVQNSFIFTLKTPQDVGVLEHEFILNTFNINDKQIQQLLDRYDIKTSDLQIIAQSKTIRSEISDQYGTWCLDANEFDWGKDYELEYELHENVILSEAKAHYLKTIENMNIEFKKAYPKYIRALNLNS